MIMLTDTQRTDEWYYARLGRITGSVAGDMLATIKKGESASRRNLRTRLVLERLTGVSQESRYVSVDMQYGIDREPAALVDYEARTGYMVRRVGFCAHDELQAGASPDGVVGNFDGIIELKCCKPATHLEFLKTGTIPSDHLAQCTHNLWITGAKWCDYISFDDRFPSALHCVVQRVHRSTVERDAYELMVRTFLNEVDREVTELQSKVREHFHADLVRHEDRLPL